MNYLNEQYRDLKAVAGKYKQAYKDNTAYPHIVFDNFFDPLFLKDVLNEFPDLQSADHIHYRNPNELKLASVSDKLFGPGTRSLMQFLFSHAFLDFLQELTGTREALLPDPYYEGAGYHEIKRGGFLKIHSDFNKHAMTGLDRRLNLLIYLNENWQEAYGGSFELWSKDMAACEKKILPLFNRVVIFSTTDYSFHGHPDPINCPEDRSRKSIALYYYSNGRPQHEVDPLRQDHPALFLARATDPSDKTMKAYNSVLNTFMFDIMPPVTVRWWRKLVTAMQKK